MVDPRETEAEMPEIDDDIEGDEDEDVIDLDEVERENGTHSRAELT